MLSANPAIATIVLIECPGTEDAMANLQLGRMIHDRGIITHAPNGSSVRSGGVDLFLAGIRRIADPGSKFAVHSWVDDHGMEPRNFSPSSPENRVYIDYYRAMGLTEVTARAFYDLTNSVPNSKVRWLTPEELMSAIQN